MIWPLKDFKYWSMKYIDESQKHYAEWETPVLKGYIFCKNLYDILEKTNNRDKEENCGFQELGVGESFNCKWTMKWNFGG